MLRLNLFHLLTYILGGDFVGRRRMDEQMQEMPGLGILDLSVFAVGHRAGGFPRVI